MPSPSRHRELGLTDAEYELIVGKLDREPNHVELFRNDAVRVYEARIDPGTATLYHHHSLDTIYVIMAGGRFRSEEPAHQKSSTKLGRSVSLPTKPDNVPTVTAPAVVVAS